MMERAGGRRGRGRECDDELSSLLVIRGLCMQATGRTAISCVEGSRDNSAGCTLLANSSNLTSLGAPWAPSCVCFKLLTNNSLSTDSSHFSSGPHWSRTSVGYFVERASKVGNVEQDHCQCPLLSRWCQGCSFLSWWWCQGHEERSHCGAYPIVPSY